MSRQSDAAELIARTVNPEVMKTVNEATRMQVIGSYRDLVDRVVQIMTGLPSHEDGPKPPCVVAPDGTIYEPTAVVSWGHNVPEVRDRIGREGKEWAEAMLAVEPL